VTTDRSPRPGPLHLYGARSDRPALDWESVERRLVEAGTYWVTARSAGHPHPRPVWGIWSRRALLLSIGSPGLVASVGRDPRITVHLDSGTDVVIVEGTAQLLQESDAASIAAYDAKYEWTYDLDEYGPLTRVDPTVVMAWRSGGWAGRDGFEAVGRWTFG
jgi:hypothetical protein